MSLGSIWQNKTLIKKIKIEWGEKMNSKYRMNLSVFVALFSS